MLPKKILLSKSRWLWITLLLFSPLAYLLGAWLVVKYDAAVKTGLSIDRESAIAIATEAASSKGVNVAQWSSLCLFKQKPNNDLYFYQSLPANPERDLARKILPATTIGVLFRSPDRNEHFEVEMTVDGRVIGHTRRLARAEDESDPGEAVARKVAAEALQNRLIAAGLSYPFELQLNEPAETREPQQSPAAEARGATRRYTWKWPLTTIPELSLESVLVVNGGKLMADRVEAKVDSDFVKRHLNQRFWLKVISIIAYVLAVTIFLVFGIYRFIQRARQKEVSYPRVVVLVALFGSALTSFLLASDTVVYNAVAANPGFPLPDLALQFSVAMFYVVAGLFLGLAYGSGEGDIRESYPGKLTSLDALLVGKIFSRNVGRSTVWGWAMGGWLMLGFQLATLPWAVTPGLGEPPNQLADAWLGYFPPLASFLTWPSDVMLILVIGILVPLPLLLRRRWLGRATLPMIFLCTWIACAVPYLDFRPWDGALLIAAVRAGIILLAFLKFDLLTAIIAMASPTFLNFSIGMAAQPASSLRQAGIISIVVAFIILAIELYFAFKGKIYREEEVRPVYARNLAERLSMQAEVSAAREAQRRLMPAELPRSEHFSIAASCLPAFEVGGDFYDVYELESGKIGVLIAEGGGRGLGSALSIAFAKGFLMPKILSSKQTDDSPTEIIRALQDRLSVLLDEETGVGLAYAVFDASDGQLRYARTHAYPSVLAGRKNSSQGMSPPAEREIKFSSRQNPESHITIVEGSMTLNPGDSVALFTDRLAQNWKQDSREIETEFAKVVNTAHRKPQEYLQQVLDSSINECSKRARKQGVDDDLTALIVRLDKLEKSESEIETVNTGGSEL